METPGGEMELYLRALEGFPESMGGGFGLSDIDFARLELVLRFIPHNSDVSDARFLCITRSLRDIVQLDQRVNGSPANQSETHTTSQVVEMTDAYANALSWPRFGSISQQTDRLMWQLESFLTSMLTQPRHSAAVKAFFGHHVVSSKTHGDLVERCLSVGSGEHHGIQEVAIASGSSHEEDVEIKGRESVLIAWKFSVEDASGIDFSVVSRPREDSVGAGDVPIEVDPYSVEAMAWEETETHNNQRVTLLYPLQYTRDDQWVYGAYKVSGDAVVTLEWTNADTASILSKPLRFQVATIASNQRAGNTDYASLWTLFEVSDSAEEDDPLAWLEELVETSTASTWPGEKGGNDEERVGFDQDASQSDVSYQQGTKQSIAQVLELEHKVFELEEELRTVRLELKGTKSELEISSEIYKASLETITQLETTAVQRQPSQRQHTDRKASFDDIFDSGDDSGGEEEAADEFDLDSEDEAESEPTDAETTRLRGLVATFQEQCLWRSIETTESEKRSLLLELELTRVDEQVNALTATLSEKDKELEELRSETQKLKAQKSVLVKEVKRLQPYSQVNLATLIHEAEEARMMQRSLQAQLNALAAASPETDHP